MSFYTTCFATNQVIRDGDKCRIIPIRQMATYKPVALTLGDKSATLYGASHSVCHPDSFWCPAGAFIPATYSDEGWNVTLELNDRARTNLVEFFWQALKNCPDAAQGENTSHEPSFSFSAFMKKNTPGLVALFAKPELRRPYGVFPLESSVLDSEIEACQKYIWKAAHHQRVFMRDYLGEFRPLEFAVMHEETYQALLEAMSTSMKFGQSQAPEAFFDRCFAGIEKSMERLRSRGVALAAQSTAMEFMYADELRQQLQHFGGSNYIYPVFVEDAVLSRVAAARISENASIEQVAAILRPLLDDRYVLEGLSEYNLRFSPMIYACEDNLNTDGVAYAKLVAEVSKRTMAARKNRYEDEFAEVTPAHSTSTAAQDRSNKP